VLGRYERAVKSSFKQANTLVGGLLDIVRGDLRRQEVHLDEEMHERVNEVHGMLVEVASIQDAIIAGSTEVKRELEKARRRLSKSGDRDAMRMSILDVAARLGELRQLHNDAVSRIQKSLARPPNAVDLIERMTKDLLKMSGSWESAAREIDEVVADSVDPNPPVEMVEIRRELDKGGYDLLLAGDERDEESLERSRIQINDLIGKQPQLNDG
jgi:hypothetical protein